MSNETTDISSEIEKIAKRGASGETGAWKFRFPDFTIFLWGMVFHLADIADGDRLELFAK